MRRKSQADFIKAGEGMAQHNAKLKALIEAAEIAADWLCVAHIGSDQRERGEELRDAIAAFTGKPKPPPFRSYE